MRDPASEGKARMNSSSLVAEYGAAVLATTPALKRLFVAFKLSIARCFKHAQGRFCAVRCHTMAARREGLTLARPMQQACPQALTTVD